VHGGPLSGYGITAMPHALLLTNRLFMTVSLRAPVTVIPVADRSGPRGPDLGDVGVVVVVHVVVHEHPAGVGVGDSG